MKKFVLRLMACLMMAVMIGTCMGNAGTVFAENLEAAYTGSVTFSDSSWWTEHQFTMEELLGSVAPEDVVNVTFSSDTTFSVGYNTSSAGGWTQKDGVSE